MKINKLVSLLITLGISCHVYADIDNQTTNPPTPQQQKQIDSLTKQIYQIQKQASTPTVGQKISKVVMLDTANPFGLMADTIFSLQILQAKQNSGFTKPLVLGGYLEIDPQIWGGNLQLESYNYKSGNSIFLSTAKLYALGNINDWVSTFLSFNPVLANSSNTSTFDQAFVTFGDLNKNPLYLMIGESYLPFGNFAGNAPWANSISTNNFRISSTNQVNLGYFQNGLQLNLAVANSPTNGQSNTTFTQNLQNFVYSMDYSKSYSSSFNYSIGASYLSDIRGANSNIGQAYNSTLSGKKNGAYDLNGSIGYRQVILEAEYDSTTSSATNLNGTSTGVLSSWMTTLNYDPVIAGQITTFSLGYSQSKNTANVPYAVSGNDGLPTTGLGQGFKQEWIAFAQRPIFNNVYLGPEFDYAKTYSGNHTWTGTIDISAYF